MSAKRIRFGITAGMADARRYLDWGELAERSGFDLLGCGDSQCLVPELHVTLGALAVRTSRALLCSTVTNPVTRHPAVVASAFATVQQLAGGRARYCVGTGDSATAMVGEHPARMAEFAECCRAFRALTNGDEAEYRGKRFRLEWEAPAVPLFIAAEGPRMLHLAGELGDGVLMGNGLTEEVIRDNLRRLRNGALEAGRDPEGIEPWFFTKVYLCESEDQAWEELAGTLAASANHVFRGDVAEKFVPAKHVAALERLRAGYVSREHNGLVHAPVRNAALVIENGLIEFLGPRFLIAGPPHRVLERIEELASWGATNLLLPAIFGDPFATTSRLAAEVLRPLGISEGSHGEVRRRRSPG